MKHVFIINPVAGQTDVAKMLLAIHDVCDQMNIDFDIEITKSIGDAQDIAEFHALRNKECRIYSIGGDGTLNEIVNGIAKTDATLGVIPSGSGNDFFRMLSDDKENIIDRTVNGDVESINVGQVNDKYFINIASLGYDAEVAYNAFLMKKKKMIPNNMIYYASIFYTLLSYKSPKVKITFNDMTIEQPITLLTICNGKYYGNGVPIAPRADYSDDLFEVYLADRINKFRIPLLLTDVLKGNHEKYNFVHPFQTNYIKVEAERPINCNVDGEIITDDTFEFMIIKNKMKVIRPKKTTL